MKSFDYIIVGQGLAGSTLAMELIERGKSVIVFDSPKNNRASSVAAGLFNPITGKYMTKTWKADVVFPLFGKFYQRAERILNKRFFYQLPVYRPFSSSEERQQWRPKSESGDLEKYLLGFHDGPVFGHQVYDPLGGIEIGHSGYLDVISWLTSIRGSLLDRGCYQEEQFQEERLSFTDVVDYQGVTAQKVIFCTGLSALQSAWFQWLPLVPLKGETLEVRISTRLDRIFNQGVYIVPTLDEHVYRVGSTYQRDQFFNGVTSEAKEELQTKLRALLRLPFEIIHQDWGIRPTTPDRRPLLGAHPANKNVVIFNGLGTKGVSLAPYLACHLADWLEGKGDLSAEVNIYRFKALY